MIRGPAQTFSLLFNAGLFALVVAAAMPGPHRFLAPGSYGLTEIGADIWTDAPGRAEALTALVEDARDRVRLFFGGEPTRPTVVLCATRACAETFGVGGNGLSLAYLAVIVSPGGLTLGTLTHEMTHSRLHRGMGLRNVVAQPFPTWFDEGLATHVARHPVWQGTVTPEARRRVREVRRFWQWDDAYREIGVGRAYASAAAEVAEIERRAGRRGLLELIRRADDGERFDQVLVEILTR